MEMLLLYVPWYLTLCISVLSQIKPESFYCFPSWELSLLRVFLGGSVPCLHDGIRMHLLCIHADGLQTQGGKGLTLEQCVK